MFIDNRLLWLAPYIELVNPIINIARLNELLIITESEHKKQKAYGLFIKNNNKFLIKLYPNVSKLNLLKIFAHELAHLSLVLEKKEWAHTPEHAIITAQITIIFMNVLINEKYISEEREIKHV